MISKPTPLAIEKLCIFLFALGSPGMMFLFQDEKSLPYKVMIEKTDSNVGNLVCENLLIAIDGKTGLASLSAEHSPTDISNVYAARAAAINRFYKILQAMKVSNTIYLDGEVRQIIQVETDLVEQASRSCIQFYPYWASAAYRLDTAKMENLIEIIHTAMKITGSKDRKDYTDKALATILPHEEIQKLDPSKWGLSDEVWRFP